MQTHEKVALALLLAFAISIILFVCLSTSAFEFGDAAEYISLMRNMAGLGNGKSYSAHSLLYSAMAVPFLYAWHSVTVIKLYNVLWIILTALLLWHYYKDRKVFFLWAACPLVWITSIQISPLLPAAFFFSAAYVMFKQWEASGKKGYLALSALSAGMMLALYAPSIVPLAAFMLVFFYDKQFSKFLYFIAIFIVPVIVSIIIDYLITGFPGYSFVTYFGADFVVMLGKKKEQFSYFQGLVRDRGFIYLAVVVSPLLFRIFKTPYQKYKREILMLIPCYAIMIVRGGSMKYFIVLVPITLILLSSVFSKKDMLISALLSVIVVAIFTYGYFGHTTGYFIDKDMDSIYNDFNFSKAIAGTNLKLNFWGDTYFFWPEEYYMEQDNKEYFVKYAFVSKPKIDMYKQLEIEGNLKRYGEQNIPSDLPFIDWKNTSFEGLVPVKCYERLCVYNHPNKQSV